MHVRTVKKKCRHVLKNTPCEIFWYVRQKIFDRKSWSPPPMHKIFLYLKLSEIPKGSFWYCETNFSTKKFLIFFVIPSMLYPNFLARQMGRADFELLSFSGYFFPPPYFKYGKENYSMAVLLFFFWDIFCQLRICSRFVFPKLSSTIFQHLKFFPLFLNVVLIQLRLRDW